MRKSRFSEEQIIGSCGDCRLAAHVRRPILCVPSGRYAVAYAERSIEASMNHLTARVHQAA